MTDNDRILNRIKKMLTLAADAAATEGERDNALRMAYATMQKHNIDIATAEGHDVRKAGAETVQRDRIWSEFVSHHWARVAAFAVAGLFFCEYYYQRDRYTGHVKHAFIGRTSNVVTAAHMAQFLCESIQSEATKTTRGLGGGAHRDFCKGATARIARRCRDMRAAAEQAEQTAERAAPGTALVLASFYAQEKKGNELVLVKLGVTSLKAGAHARHAKNSAAYLAGHAYGDRVNLDRQVGGAT